jgi:hypothetical protein
MTALSEAADRSVQSAVSAARAAIAQTPKRRGRPPGAPPGHRLKPSALSDAARTSAAVVLEVLAGIRGPSDAAKALGVSAMRYYQLEKRAVEGLVAGCEPRPMGRQPGVRDDGRLQKECDRLKQDVSRHQALLRSAQRALGVAPAPAATGKPEPGKRMKRKPTVRALSIVNRLRSSGAAAAAASGGGGSSVSIPSDPGGG